MKKILNILLGIFMAISTILAVYAMFFASDKTPASINLNILWAYFLLMAALGSSVFCIAWGMIKSPAGIRGSVISLALVVITIGAAYFFASGHTFEILDLQTGGFFDRAATVITDTSLLVAYVSFVAAFVIAIGTEIYAAFK